MNNFADRLISEINRKKSCIIVGLDPRLDLIPKSIYSGAKSDVQSISGALLDFNKAIIDIIKDDAVGVKPQSAFYEKYGWVGVKAFWETCAYAKKKGLITVADVKRGDVPSTAEAYAEAYFKSDDIDSITVNPFLGGDSLQPFIKLAKEKGKGMFVLVKTSNPGSKDFQDKVLSDGRKLYTFLAEEMNKWGKELIGEKGYSSLGAVVGATFPEEASALRKIMPNQVFLVPGYGAQGGRAEDIKVNFNKDGLGALINAARSVIHSYKDPAQKDWADSVKNALIKMKQEIQLHSH
jgi:orotidine-5'-phosphate decarboxylase